MPVAPEIATLSQKQGFENLFPSWCSIDTFSLIYMNVSALFMLCERK